MNYYNEFDPQAAAWLRELIIDKRIPYGIVDERSITEITPNELKGYIQCHFFAGIGGWSFALQLAGWPDSQRVWTGSCPCQPFSQAGKQKGQADSRHLWPTFFGLIAKCRPDVVFGEQVESAIGHGWLDGVQADLEGESYAVGHCVLGAHSVGGPHIRQRLYWVADAGSTRSLPGSHTRVHCGEEGAWSWDVEPERRGDDCGVADAESERRNGGAGVCRTNGRSITEANCRLGNPKLPRSQGRCECRDSASELSARSSSVVDGLGQSNGAGRNAGQLASETAGHRDTAIATSGWDDYELWPCSDGKTRRVKSGLQPLAHGVPNRVALLRGAGNAIVPQVAAEFIAAYMETDWVATTEDWT